MTVCPVFLETRSWPRNWKSSFLLSSFRKTFFQFTGSLAWRVPVPRLKFQTVLRVYIAGEIHALGFQGR